MVLCVLRIWKFSEMEKGYPRKSISGNCTASSAPRTLATMANSLVFVEDRSNFESTSAVSFICGIAFGDTKLPKSKVWNPQFNKRSEERRVGKECRSRWSLNDSYMRSKPII